MEFIGKIIELLKSDLVQAIGLFLLMVVEFWLGRTELVKAGSTLEAIFNGVKKVLEVLGIKKPA